MKETASTGLPVLLSHTLAASAEHNGKVRVCVIMTSFNRREITLECLRVLTHSQDLEAVCLSMVLADDGSTDGTCEAVQSEFPWVEIVHGDGALFWCRGMYTAWQVARQGNYDFYLWLNDDTRLCTDALARLLVCEQSLRSGNAAPVIVVGSTRDEKSGVLTYGGEVRSKYWRTRFRKVGLAEHPQRCDSMTGNIVLVSPAAMKLVGNLDPAFEHAMGDTDYALRANRLGVPVWAAPGVFGVCSDNSTRGTFSDSNLPLRRRWKSMMSHKGLPWRSWLLFTRRHTGWFWPVYFCWPYVRVVVESVVRGKL
jgi:GT2 family glycosyltransferase